MISIICRVFEFTFKLVSVLIVTGTLYTVIHDLRSHAWNSRNRGLTSMLKINEQLVGKVR
jgi:hypothetical protein